MLFMRNALPCTPAVPTFNPAKATLAATLWDATLVTVALSSPASSRSPLSPPRSLWAPDGRGGSRASFLTNELLGTEKRFFFVVVGSGEDDVFSEVRLVGEKFIAMEAEVEAEVSCEEPRRRRRRFREKKK